MIKKLAEKKLVHYESYKPLRLSEKGKKEAKAEPKGETKVETKEEPKAETKAE